DSTIPKPLRIIPRHKTIPSKKPRNKTRDTSRPRNPIQQPHHPTSPKNLRQAGFLKLHDSG
ncbi:hypothetical protein HMPREF0577_1710, partial [Mobiluncus mulieris ATCC 35243]